MIGNDSAVSHGVYSEKWSPEELEARAAWEREVIAAKGRPGVLERCLIHEASWLWARIHRIWRAMAAGRGEPASEHTLSWINSLRLLCCAIGLKDAEAPAMTLQDLIRQTDAKAAAEAEQAEPVYRGETAEQGAE